MSKRVLIVALIISAAINVGAVLTLSYYWLEERSFKRAIPSRSMPEGDRWRRSFLRHKLNLTEEQTNAIDVKHQEMMSSISPLRHELLVRRRELMSLLRETELNKARAGTLLREIASLQTKVDSQVFENLCQIRDILTPEQQKRFFVLLEERQRYPMGMGPPPWEEHFKRKMKNSGDRRRGGGRE